MTNSCLKSGSGDWAEWTRDDVEPVHENLSESVVSYFGVYLYLFFFLYALPNPRNRNMSANEDYKLSSSSEKREQETQSDGGLWTIWTVQRGHSSDDNEDIQVDEDGLSPAVLRSWFEG